MNGLCKKPLTEVLPLLHEENLRAALDCEPVYEYVMRNGTEKALCGMEVAQGCFY